MNWIINKINEHFFAPQRVRDLSIIRVIVVGVQLTFLILSIFGIEFGNNANLDIQFRRSLLDIKEFQPVISLKILLAPFGWGARPDFMLLNAVWLLALITGFTSLFGFIKRISLFLFAAANTILIGHAYSYGEHHHPEAILILFIWVLAFGENSKTWSIDSLRKKILVSTAKMKFEPRERNLMDIYSRWPIRIMQWLFALIYISAGIEKLKGGFNSYSMMFQMAKDGLLHDRSLAIWLSNMPILLDIIAPIAVVFELSFFIVMFIPNLAWVYVLFGSIFHLSIYIIHAPPFLHYIPLYIVFIEPIRNFWAKRIKWKIAESKWNIIYDGFCPLCIRTVTIIDYFDFRKKINFMDFENEKQKVEQLNKELKHEDLKHSMHLISPDGKIYKGFFAFEKLAPLLPILWLMVPFLKIPFVSKAGNFFYNKIARNRKRHVCNAEYCNI